jgi:uncharacterized Tic20 family protein
VIQQPAQYAPTSEERNWAMAAHLSALVAVAGIPFGHVVGPLVVYLTQRQRSAFVAEHARASLNFQITVSIALIALLVVLFGSWIGVVATLPARDASFPFWAIGLWVVTMTALAAGGIAVLVFIIVGTVAASKDQPYRYPFSIEFVR